MTNYTSLETSKQSSVASAEIELRRLIEDAETLSRKARLVAYNYERSFIENVKEISGEGLTAEEAKKKWGLLCHLLTQS